MRYDNAELIRQLGAEYVIGTLQGAARRRFERLMHTDAEARAQVAFWELRLSEFGQVLPPVAPPAAARAEMLRRAEPVASAGTLMAPRRRGSPRRRRARWAWSYAAGFATAAALVLAFLAGQRNPAVPSGKVHEVVASEVQTEAGLPIYVAEVRMPASSMGWLLSVSPDHRQLLVTASDDFFQAGLRRLQLWCLVPGEKPIGLGKLPVERDAVVHFDIPAAVQGASDVSFVISLESEDGPHQGWPSGPVLSTASALDAI